MFWSSLEAQKVQGPAALAFPKNSLSDLDASQNFGSTILEDCQRKARHQWLSKCPCTSTNNITGELVRICTSLALPQNH